MTRAAEVPRRRRGLRHNALSLMLGHAAFVIGYWLQLMILARAGGPSAVGSYAYALALAGPAASFANLNLRALLASDAAGAYAFREYLALRGASIAAAMLATVLIGWSTGGGSVLLAVLVPVCVMRAAESLSDIYYGAWQLRERMGVIGWSLGLNGLSSALLMGAALALGGGVPGAAIGSALGSCAALVFVGARAMPAENAQDRGTPPDPLDYRRLLRLAAQAAPLGLISFLLALQANVPRYFIRGSADEAALGLFAAAHQLPAAGGIVVAALGSAAVPRLASLHAGGQGAAFHALTRKLVLTTALLGCAGVALSALVGRQLLFLLYGPEFAAADRMLVVLSAAAGLSFAASLQGHALTAARILAIQPVVLALVIAVLAAGCSALVPRYGGIGAAWAIVAASAVHALASWVVLRRRAAADRR